MLVAVMTAIPIAMHSNTRATDVPGSENTLELTSEWNLYSAMLKRHGPFVAFYFYCKIMLYGINYTYYSVKTVKICLHVPLGLKIDAVRGA